MGFTDEYIDVIASADRAKIECVIRAMGAGAIVGGVGAAVTVGGAAAVPGIGQISAGTIIGISAVLGAFSGYKLAKMGCGLKETEGSLEKALSFGRAPASMINAFEQDMMATYGVSSDEARLLSQAAVLSYGQTNATTSVSPTEKANAVALFLSKAKAAA